ncbi:MAG TPA: hypothetical protein VGO14_10250 [Solirubrobacteraceae bacterium]|nr:hypothetical protein [Solirubrobacteraceae bacterium]
MTDAVAAGAVAVAVLNAVPGLLGGLLWYRASPLQGRLGQMFWIALRVGQGAAVAFAVAVGSLAAAGSYSSDKLFYLYALLPLAVAFVAEQLRVTSAQTILDQRGLDGAAAVGALPEPEQRAVVAEIMRRELGIMALAALVVVFLAVRAAGTAGGF